MKKIFAIMLALVLVLAMGIPAMAATITINNNVATGAGSVGNETFTAYKIFDASLSTDGSKVAYTVESGSYWYNALKDYNGLSFTEVTGQGKYNVAMTESFDEDDFIEEIINNLSDAPKQDLTGYGAHTLSGGNGYYYITSTLGSGVIFDTITTKVITEKNDYPSVTKKIVVGANKVDATTADRGQTITFEIAVTIPTTANQEIVVHDTLETTMTYVAGQTLASGVTKRAATCNPACSYEFVIDKTTVEANKGNTFTFTYTATLNGDAATATDHKNTAYITYSTFKSVVDEVKVTTYELDVFKYTEDSEGNKIGLAGAKFALKNSDGNYYKNDNGVVTWVTNKDNASVLTTAADSYTVNFAGLANGTYTLVETDAPSGYNPASDMTVTINGANLTGDAQIEVLNNTGSKLPSTGGIGTTIFYVVGGLLMAAAIVLLVTKKKVSSK